ncbi:MAG: T9SS type A sorting domain-containing protein, partial [Saprospiraceae bacterium]|nr:T9SS type A sorting domain-containing protein [Saprospiraceae bacterium]
ATTATLRVFDASGRVVWEQSGAYAKGQNSIWVDRAAVGNSGILYYTLETETDSATKKMIQTK